MEYDRVQLKLAAKRAMKGQRPHPMLITLLFSVLVNIGSQLVSRILGAASGSNSLTTAYAQAFLQHEDPQQALHVLLSFGPQRLLLALLVGGFLSSVIASLWAGVMRVGYSNFCLGMARGQQPQTGALFSALPQLGGVILTQFLAGLFRFLWAMLLVVALAVVLVVLALLLHSLPALFAVLMAAAYTVFLVGLVWVTLRYAMVDFLIADQGLTGMDAVRESKRLMQGNTGRLFTLELSFIGWYLLEFAILFAAFAGGGAALFGAGLIGTDPGNLAGAVEVFAGAMLGFFGIVILAVIAVSIISLWLSPYITGTEALFYDWIRGADSTKPSAGAGRGWDQQPSQRRYDYTWNSGPSQDAGTGIGPGPRDGGPAPQPPKSPKDDPWK